MCQFSVVSDQGLGEFRFAQGEFFMCKLADDFNVLVILSC